MRFRSVSLAGLLAGSLACQSPLLLGANCEVAAAKESNALRIALGSEPQTLDPGLCTESVSHEIIGNLFAALIELDPETLTAVPELAEHWDVDDSGLRWTFYLREAFWSDGVPIVADDFVFSWRRVVDPKVGSRAASLMSIIKGAQAAIDGRSSPEALGVRSLGPRVLEVTLERRAPYFLQLLSQPVLRPVPRHVLVHLREQKLDETRWTRPEFIVTSGAFELERWRFKRDLRLKKSRSYFDADNVSIDQVTWTIVENASTLTNLYLTGELDWTGSNGRLPAPYINALRARPDFNSEPLLVTSFYWLNCQRGILRDVRARRALSLAIDREAITKNLLRGGEVAWAGLVPPNLPNYPSAKRPLFDPQRARALWQAAAADHANRLKKDYPSQLTLVYNTDDTNRQVAEAIQAMWAQVLGIDVTLENQEWQVFLNRVEQRDFDIARLGWVGDFADPISFLRDVVRSDAGNNASGLSNKAFDDELENADGIADGQVRLNALARAEETMLETQPLIPLFASEHASLLRPGICGLGRNVLGQHPLKFAFWFPSNKPCPKRLATTPNDMLR